MTRFKVLARVDDSDWYEHSEQDAHSADAAVKAAYMKKSERVHAMVAVPARSWRPQQIRTETVQKVVLGEPPTPEQPK